MMQSQFSRGRLMTARDEFIQRVTQFLAVRKDLAGIEAPMQWAPGRQSGEHCIKLPIEVGGIQRGQVLMVVFVPGRQTFAINIVWAASVCVTRLDFDPHGGHTNGFASDMDGLPSVVGGKHFHRWLHNVRFVDATASLQELKHAEDLPTSIRNFNDALRYFCDETAIDLPNGHYIELPRMLI
jgi:hypothetical protein